MAVGRICRGMAFIYPRGKEHQNIPTKERRELKEKIKQSAGPDFRDGGMISECPSWSHRSWHRFHSPEKSTKIERAKRRKSSYQSPHYLDDTKISDPYGPSQSYWFMALLSLSKEDQGYGREKPEGRALFPKFHTNLISIFTLDLRKPPSRLVGPITPLAMCFFFVFHFFLYVLHLYTTLGVMADMTMCID